MKVGLYGYNDTCIKVYDPEQQLLIGVFKNYKDASNKLGLTASCVQHTCARKGRSYCKTLNKELAIRLSKPESNQVYGFLVEVPISE